MIKINAQRVEPGEIEALLMDYPGIDTAVVKGFSDEHQRSILCAYYTCNRELNEEQIRKYLEKLLPHYMIPSVFVKMDKLPLNANGKVDRKALRKPDISSLLDTYEAPVGKSEEMLCKGFAGRTPQTIAKIAADTHKDLYSELPRDIKKAKLTSSQMNILLECGMCEKRTLYNIPLHISSDKTEAMTVKSVKAAVDSVIKVHPALYADIIQDAKDFFMLRREFPKNGICTCIEGNDELISEYAKAFIKPIALGEDPLCTATAILGVNKVHIFINMHHIVSDGTSVTVLCRQITEALNAVPPQAETIDAFALFEVESRLEASGAIKSAKTYFDNLLSQTDIDSNIIPDHNPKENSEAASMYRNIDAAIVKKYLKTTNITENTFFMGVFGYVLAKMTGQSESLFAVAENGRKSSSKLNNTVSMLVKTLPVVIKIDEEKSAKSFLKALQTQFFATMRNDTISFSELAKEHNIRSDVMFVYQSDMFSGYDSKNGHTDIEIPSLDEALANLSMMINKKDSTYSVKLEYRKNMYEEYTITRFLDLFEKTVELFTTDTALKNAVLISDTDKAFLDLKNTELSNTQISGSILDYFSATVARYPQKTAVICKDVQYTYKQVDEITDRIAAYIHGLGIGRTDVVSVLIPRGEYMMIATLGVLKSGAAYEPLDPAYPPERLAFMISDANAKLLIKDRSLDHILTDYKGSKLYTDDIASLPNKKAVIEPPAANDTFVLLYTSGTTGKPKGIMLTHSNLANFVAAHTKTLGLNDDCIVANYASYGFDAHMADLYPAVANGATLVIIPDEMRLDLDEVKKYCESMRVTHLFMTTQVARQFALQFDKVDYLRCLSTGGEKLASFNPAQSYKVINLYGPSECTVCVTSKTVDKYYDNIPIGQVTLNSRAYIVDKYDRRVPIGVPGELIICGSQVGAGYIGKTEQTEKVFVPNTYEYAQPPYNRCYKSGDIVRFINDGNIEYIGRRDHQIKIRGFRIELGEIESAIREYDGIQDVTTTVTDNNGTTNICAYIVADKQIDITELNSSIGQAHPAYMIPAVTMQIDSIPLTANGKVDKKKLPLPQLNLKDIKKPETKLQKTIFDKVKETVGTDGFGIDTDIYSAGLTSIGSIRLCTLLAQEFKIPVKIRDLKRNPTVLKLEELVLRLTDNNDKDTELPKSEKNQNEAIEYGESYPITKTMEGIFVECMQRPESTVYNIPFLLKADPCIDISRLKKAIASAVQAHPCMNAELYYNKEGKVCQHIRKNDTFTENNIKEITLASADELNSSLIKAFPLTGARLFEISIISIKKDKYLFINAHHIIFDGTSIVIFIKDIEKAYAGETLAQEAFTGFDVASEENTLRTRDELEYEKAYYGSLLGGLDKDFLLLSDKPLDLPKASGRLILSQMEANADEIREYCQKHRIGMNSFFVSIFGFTLAKYAGTDYSVFNTVYNGRNDSRKMDTIAMLVKTLPVVCHIDKDKVEQITSEISQQLMDSMSNDLYSYAEISREFGVKNDVMFIFQGDSFSLDTFCNKPVSEIELGLSESKATMTLQVMIKDGKLIYDFEYDPNRFTEKMGISFIRAVDKAASSFVHTDDISKVSILSELAEAEMDKYNDTEVEYDKSKTIVDHFLNMVRSQPEHLCVEYNHKRLTFAQVGELAKKLAMLLMKKGIGRSDVVSILINRDENMVITAHGVELTGAAYLGLDPTYPPERLEFMIRDSGSKCLIADRALMETVKNYTGDVIYVDEIANLPATDEAELKKFMLQDKHKVTPEDDALIIYSSGTTGLPKGSVLRHRNIVCFFHNYITDMNIGFNANVATYASFGFDGGAMDVFSAPMSGASLYIIPDDIRLDLGKLEQFFLKNGITNGFMTTQVGCMFIARTKCRSLKHFLVGGETLIPVMGPEWVTFRNGYGPSEAMCYVNKYRVCNTGSLQPIGTVSNNTKEYIIDKFGNRLPYGACGELCISGGQVGRGYLNNPEKTQQVFVKNPFTDKVGYEIMYRTGDVVRMLTDGNYDFVGRRDGQVKIRGFRIELSEVEQQIRKYPGVTKTVVKAFDNPSGGKFLAAYVLIHEGFDPDDLKSFIAKEKPDYMIPAVIIRVDDIPLTSNGKVDMTKLPKPELGSARMGKEPENKTEEKLCRIFAEVIGLDKVYADDDFFKIGGSSISAIQAVVKCELAGFPVVYKNLFANPTPQRLSAFISGGNKEADVTATDLDKNDEHDYSALKYNVISNLPKIKYTKIGDVLLTGSTGFLGSHIFHELIESTSGKIICLVRGKKKLDAATRFKGMMIYYFEEWYNEEIEKRTVVIDATLEDKDLCKKLAPYHFDTIINCAANVKHFAVEEELLKSNFSGVENLIKLAETNSAKLIQISSLSVSGESVNGSIPSGYIFKESDLNIGQSLENRYIYTKYLGEQAVIDAVSKKRIKGKVIRLGNLMARTNDSEFQINAGSNAFLRMFIGFAKLRCFPINMLDAQIEFSPIDNVAKAVILLSGTPDEFTVFHAKNCNTIHYSYLLKAIMDAGYPIEIVEDYVFEKRLQAALKDDKRATALGGLLAYKNSVSSTVEDVTERLGDEEQSSKAEKRIQVPSSTLFTTKALYRLGFGWPLISMDYLRKMVNALIDLDFFE